MKFNRISVSMDVEVVRTRRQQQLLKLLNDSDVRKTINKKVGDAINQFVPMKTGRLRKSMWIGVHTISWGHGLKYAKYQYGGEIYGPNIPGAINGNPAWISGKKKHPTGREIGAFKGTLDIKPKWQIGEPKVTGTLPYKFGYTTPNTTHHWDKEFTMEVKRKTNLDITRYLKRLCKNRGIST